MPVLIYLINYVKYHTALHLTYLCHWIDNGHVSNVQSIRCHSYLIRYRLRLWYWWPWLWW